MLLGIGCIKNISYVTSAVFGGGIRFLGSTTDES
jgi:hypothetical protein